MDGVSVALIIVQAVLIVGGAWLNARQCRGPP
jgi:hypothetical protein